MSEMPLSGGRGEERGVVATAIVLWVIVLAGLAYGLINTFRTVVDLFAG